MSACYIAGNASNGFWDTAGESVDIHGMDISTLEGSVVNWEHLSGQPGQYVGKILKAKKIFSAEDCSNELEKKYWDKCQVPFLFCLCVLFNEYMPAAKEVAGIFEFDAANPSLKPTLSFSIEGSKAETISGVVTKSIARKLTLTALPANHACDASKVDINAPAEPVDPLSNLFKSQSVEIELLSSEKLEKMEKSMKPSTPKIPKPGLKQAPETEGMSLGTTQSGKHVMSHAKIHNYRDFSAQDHRDASVLHNNAATKANAASNSKLADHYNQKMKLHNQAAAGLERKANRFGNAAKAKKTKEELGLNKALTASDGMVAPGNKTGGAALQGENLEPLMKPYTSEAQRRWAHTAAGKEALGGDSAVHEWDEATKGKKLPEKVSKSEGKVCLPKKDFIEEHKDLVNTLKHPTKKKVNKEIKEQSSELRHMKKSEELEKSDDSHAFLGSQHPSQFKPGKKYGTKQMVYVGSNDTHHNFKHGDLNVKIPRKAILSKSELLQRAEEAYSHWEKREQFEEFMSKRLPNLAKGEIRAIGQTYLLKKSVEAEKSLNKMMGLEKALKFGSPEDQKAVANALAERAKNPPKKVEPKKKAPDLKNEVHSEVSHVETKSGHSPVGHTEYDIVHLKSGHELHGHKKGKFKVGDKVIAKPHLMGTHTLEHMHKNE